MTPQHPPCLWLFFSSSFFLFLVIYDPKVLLFLFPLSLGFTPLPLISNHVRIFNEHEEPFSVQEFIALHIVLVHHVIIDLYTAWWTRYCTACCYSLPHVFIKYILWTTNGLWNGSPLVSVDIDSKRAGHFTGYRSQKWNKQLSVLCIGQVSNPVEEMAASL